QRCVGGGKSHGNVVACAKHWQHFRENIPGWGDEREKPIQTTAHVVLDHRMTEIRRLGCHELTIFQNRWNPADPKIDVCEINMVIVVIEDDGPSKRVSNGLGDVIGK